MFLSSLELTKDEVQRERICDQLDKIEKQILLETNNEYEEQYLLLLGENTRLFPEEKAKLRKLISLITERKEYLENRKNKHREITGSLVELTTFLGEDKLTTFKNRLEIIEKYEDNKAKQEKLIKEMKLLDVKLSEASRTVKANARLNDILENKLRDIVNSALDKFKLYSLTEQRDEILKNYDNLDYAFNLAKDNLKIAKKLNVDDVLECEEMLTEVSKEYDKYNEKVNILKLIDVYDRNVNGYDELLEKRERINEILKNISDSKLYNEIYEELNKQYNTIKLEKQDIDNYEALKQERERKNKQLYEIEEENNSKEFKAVIDEFVKNENRVREEKVRKARKEEYQERQKKLLEEQKIEASRVRRQKLIEEARLKEQQERVEKVKELQKNTVINSKKEESNYHVDTVSNCKEEKINNPLKDKTFDEVISLNNSFDTEELFENTKIVPNKKISDESKSLLDNIENRNDETEKKEAESNVWNVPPLSETSLEKLPSEESMTEKSTMIKEFPSYDETIDLFKEEPKKEEVKIEGSEIKDDKASIYDILENNKNIIWKTTDTDINKDAIPVIGNNNFKPEILNSKNAGDVSFPKIESKEGEILWKETL